MSSTNDSTAQDQDWPFRDRSRNDEDSVSVNQRMIRQLSQRETVSKGLPAWQSRSLAAWVIEVTQNREEQSRRTMQEAAREGGLDPAFLAILESGDALPDEITPEVLSSIAKGVNARVSDLETAMAVYESSHNRNLAGQLIDAVISLCQPAFVSRAGAFKAIALTAERRHPNDEEPTLSERIDDDKAGISFKIGGLTGSRPPSFVFYEFGNESSPLQGWHVSIMSGTKELASGITDHQGAFTFPSQMTDIPPNAHIRINEHH